MGEIIAVISGKGGTGKTTVCAGIATALAKTGKRILCIDCDVGLSNLDISLGMNSTPTLSFQDVCQDSYFSVSDAAENPYYKGLYLLTAPINCRVSEIDFQSFSKMLFDAQALFDYILLDAPAGIEEGFRLAVNRASRILLVTNADPGSMRDAAHTGELLELMQKSDVRIVVNRVQRKMISSMKLTIDDVIDETGLPLFGLVPEDPNVPYAAFNRRPLLLYATGRKGAGKAFSRIARRLEGYTTPLSIR